MSQAGGDWKQKYFDSLADLEHKERRWQSVESSLRRCISRLTFVADGIDGQLDQRLEQLRNRVRGEQDMKSLQESVEEITRLAERAAESKGSNTSLAAEVFLDQLINEAHLPEALAKRARGLSKSLQKQPLQAETLQSAKQLLLEAIGPGEEREGRAGLFGKLFAKDKGGSDRMGEGSASTAATDHALQSDAKQLLVFLLKRLQQGDISNPGIDTLALRVDHAANLAQLEKLASELADLLAAETAAAGGRSLVSVDQVLLQLIEQLDLSAPLQPRVDAVKNRLTSGLEEKDILPLLGEIVQLVEYAKVQAEQERQEVERFLLRMTEQLQEVDREVGRIDEAGHRLVDGGKKMDAEMQRQVATLQYSLTQSTDLEDLKSHISQRLNLIEERLRGHRSDTEQLVDEFERRISSLTAQLSELEQDREGLRASVEKARQDAFTDALTGLNNRHAFDLRLQEEYARWSRYAHPLSLIVVDVDFFKKVNDTYGHLAGDKVLHVIGAHLQHATRHKVDFTARYGGEEFVVLLPETNLNDALSVAEKIRHAVEQKPFRSGSNRVNITVSCGVASFQQGDGRKSPFERADEALYLAKREGRNRCRSELQIVKK